MDDKWTVLENEGGYLVAALQIDSSVALVFIRPGPSTCHITLTTATMDALYAWWAQHDGK